MSQLPKYQPTPQAIQDLLDQEPPAWRQQRQTDWIASAEAFAASQPDPAGAAKNIITGWYLCGLIARPAWLT